MLHWAATRYRPSRRRVFVPCFALALAICAQTSLRAQSCAPMHMPAATLLFPYFEVDLDGSRTTLIAISKVGGYVCSSGPSWDPLGEQKIIVRDEQGHKQDFEDTELFGLATQRVDVGSVIRPPHDFGWLELHLEHGSGAVAQAWVGWDANAEGRYNVSLAGIPLTSRCNY